MPVIRHKRGTRAALDALAATNALIVGQIYVITDEKGRLALADTVSSYTAFVRDTEDVSKWPFMEAVTGSGQDVTTGAFNKLNFSNEITDTHNAYNPSTAIYTIPQTGAYDILLKVRPPDNSIAGTSYGVAVGIAQEDAPFFSWFVTADAKNSGYNRQGAIYRRVSYFNQGDQLRAYYYVDSSGGIPKFESGNLIIFRVR